MAAVDLDRLCSRLSSIQADQLYRLDDDSALPIPKIRGMSVADAIATIRASISAIPDMKERIQVRMRDLHASHGEQSVRSLGSLSRC
ncbi:hypothetical protein MTO96_026547 [Rhipicephalus appendiculatus]